MTSAGLRSPGESPTEVINPTVEAVEVVADTVDTGNLQLTKGRTMQLKAVLHMTDGSSRELTEGAFLSWHTDNAAVGTVSSSGLLTAVGEGNLAVWAVYDGHKSPDVSVEVAAAVVDSLAVSGIPADKKVIIGGDTPELQVSVAMSDGTTKQLEDTTGQTYTSSDKTKVDVIDKESGDSVSGTKLASDTTIAIKGISSGASRVTVEAEGLSFTTEKITAVEQ